MSQAHLDAFRAELQAVRSGAFQFAFKESSSSLRGLLAHLEATKGAPQAFASVGEALGHCAAPADQRLAKYRDAVRSLVVAWGRPAPYPNAAGVGPAANAPALIEGGAYQNCYAFALRSTRVLKGPDPNARQAWPGGRPAGEGEAVPPDTVARPPLTTPALVAAVRWDAAGRVVVLDWAARDLAGVGGTAWEPPDDVPNTYLVGMLHNGYGFHFIRRCPATRRWSWKQGAGDPAIYGTASGPARVALPVTDANLWDVVNGARGFSWFYGGMSFDCFFRVAAAGVAIVHTL